MSESLFCHPSAYFRRAHPFRVNKLTMMQIVFPSSLKHAVGGGGGGNLELYSSPRCGRVGKKDLSTHHCWKLRVCVCESFACSGHVCFRVPFLADRFRGFTYVDIPVL